MSDRIVTEQDRLRRPSTPVAFDAKTRFLAQRLSRAASEGDRRIRGIAAPQLGVHQQMFYWNFAGLGDTDGGQRVDRGGLSSSGIACNVALLDTSDETWVREEGCLSFPGRFIFVERPLIGRFEWYTRRGDRCEVTLVGMAARVWMHELDHLHGVLMVDRAAPDAELHRLE